MHPLRHVAPELPSELPGRLRCSTAHRLPFIGRDAVLELGLADGQRQALMQRLAKRPPVAIEINECVWATLAALGNRQLLGGLGMRGIRQQARLDASMTRAESDLLNEVVGAHGIPFDSIRAVDLVRV